MTSKNRRRKRVLNNYAVQSPFLTPLPAPAPNTTVHVQSLSSKNATVAKIQVSKAKADWSGTEYQFEAADSAKREQGDRYDPITGELYAQGRAFKDLGDQMLREANHRVTKMTADLAAERNRPPRTQTRHRTLAEWQAIQKQRRHAEKEQAFKNAWGLQDKALEVTELLAEIHAPHEGHARLNLGGAVTPVHSSTEDIQLGNGQVMTVTNGAVTLYDKNGQPVVRWDRT